MPQQKGRKKKQRDRRGREGGEVVATASSSAPVTQRVPNAPAAGGPLPSTTARATGFMVALVTAFVAIMMIYGAINSDDASAPDAAIRIFIGTLLVLLSLFVGALVLFPAQIRDFMARRRSR